MASSATGSHALGWTLTPAMAGCAKTLHLNAPALTNVRHTSAISSLDKCSHALILEAFLTLKSP
jgi:hypothetical protein